MAKRNGNGEGSRPRKRTDGRWEARFWDGEMRRSVYGKTRREVSERLNLAMSDTPVSEEVAASAGAKSEITFKNFLLKYEETVRHSMKKRSFETYEEITRLHLLGRLGDLKLSEISRETVQSIYADRLADGLSAARVRRIHGVLNSILGTALEWELVDRNVCRVVKPPRVPQPEVRPLTLEEARRLLEASESTGKHHALITLGVTSGARWGELAALFWSDLDLASRTLRINRTLVRGKGRPTFDTPKTRGSCRTIRISRRACEALLAHREVAAGSGFTVTGDHLVFTSRTGGPVNHSSFTRHTFKPLLRQAGLPETTWHAATRHTCTCLLLLDRVDPKTVCLQMGWSSVAFMLENYARFMPGWGTQMQ